MGRLTERYRGTYIPVFNSNSSAEPFNDCVEKLGRLEDLEEQGRLIEQKHGRWIEHEGPYFKCSVCGISEVSQGLYCRNCGAKMDEVGNE